MAQAGINKYGMRKNHCSDNSTVIENKTLECSTKRLDSFSIFMMHVLLTIVYGILWISNLMRVRR